MRRSFAALTLVLVANCREVESSRIIPEAPSCASCRVETGVVAVIGDAGGPGMLDGRPGSIHVGRDGRYYVWAGDLPLVFEPDGRFVTAIGRRGEGPGEFRGRIEAQSIPGDSVLILEGESGQVNVFDPRGVIARETLLPGPTRSVVVLHWPDSVLVTGFLGDQAPDRWPIYLASMSGRKAGIRNRAKPVSGSRFVPEDWVTLATSQGEGGFIVQRPYRLTGIDRSLETEPTMERRPDWWTEDREFPLGRPHLSPPHPQVRAATVDADGLLWVYVVVAADSWRDAWTEVPPGAVEIPARLIRDDQLYDTLLEVIDPRTATVLARTMLDGEVVAALEDRRAAVYAETPLGVPRLRILQSGLVR